MHLSAKVSISLMFIGNLKKKKIVVLNNGQEKFDSHDQR